MGIKDKAKRTAYMKAYRLKRKLEDSQKLSEQLSPKLDASLRTTLGEGVKGKRGFPSRSSRNLVRGES